MQHLVIVESAAKAQTIAKYLNSIPEITQGNSSYKVMACLGHIQDLPVKELGIDKDTWQVKYETNSKKAKLLSQLKAATKESLASGGKIYLASDLDLEGEAIANHLKNFLKLQKKNYERVTFNEITKPALKQAFQNPGDIDVKSVAAQETRRILDRVVGYELSPLLWRRFGQQPTPLSAGRVQSAALDIVVKRYNAMKEHQYTSQWQCQGTFTPLNASISKKLVASSELLHTLESEALNHMTMLEKAATKQNKWTATFTRSNTKKSPPQPFTTSTLQQDSFQHHSISAKNTMKIAQELYEAGLITYMRTDSTHISEEATSSICSFIQDTYGDKYVGTLSSIQSTKTSATKKTKKTSEQTEKPGTTEKAEKTKKPGVQEAHEAIRPTKPTQTTIAIDDKFSAYHKKVYDLIWKRTVASQMAAAEYIKITYKITTDKPQHTDPKLLTFHGSTSILTFDGFLKVYQKAKTGGDQKGEGDDEGDSNDISELASWDAYLKQGSLQVDPQSFIMNPDVDRPKPLFNEATFVKTLEKQGIGRPSTYAAVVDKLYDKKYVEKGGNVPHTATLSKYVWIASKSVAASTTTTIDSIRKEEVKIDVGGKEKDKMIPTFIGTKVVEYLATVTPYLIDPQFTRLMESDLDRIVHSSSDGLKTTILNDFYKTFSASCEKAVEDRKVAASTSTDEGTKKKTKTEMTGPKSLKAFPTVKMDLVKTKFGPALYSEEHQKFYTITPFLEWKKVEATKLTEGDVKFITSLPRKLPDNKDAELALGRYGLFLKVAGKNVPLKKELWQKGYEGVLKYSDV